MDGNPVLELTWPIATVFHRCRVCGRPTPSAYMFHEHKARDVIKNRVVGAWPCNHKD